MKVIILTHSGKKKRHTRATIRRLAQRMIDSTGRDQRFGVRGTHPVNSCIDVAVADGLAMAYDHNTKRREG